MGRWVGRGRSNSLSALAPGSQRTAEYLLPSSGHQQALESPSFLFSKGLHAIETQVSKRAELQAELKAEGGEGPNQVLTCSPAQSCLAFWIGSVFRNSV